MTNLLRHQQASAVLSREKNVQTPAMLLKMSRLVKKRMKYIDASNALTCRYSSCLCPKRLLESSPWCKTMVHVKT